MENMVLAAEVTVLSEDPLLADMILHTLGGKAEFQINRAAAEALLDVLGKFLSEAPS